MAASQNDVKGQKLPDVQTAPIVSAYNSKDHKPRGGEVLSKQCPIEEVQIINKYTYLRGKHVFLSNETTMKTETKCYFNY